MLAKLQKSAYRLLMKISAGWGCGNSVVLDISADWVVEILLLIKIFDRLGNLIYIVF
jgi:hypothetical protein